MTKNLCVVMAHGAAQKTFERHFVEWEKHGADMLIICPVDDKINCPGIQVMAMGKREHHGLAALTRFFGLLQHVEGMGYEHVIIHEYDSFCLGANPKLDWTDDIAGNSFGEDNPNANFEGKMYVHPPLIFSLAGIKRITAALPSQVYEQGFWDRWLGRMIEITGATHHNFGPIGFSLNTIHAAHYPALKDAVRNGARWIHGVKDAETYKLLKKLEAKYCQALDDIEI